MNERRLVELIIAETVEGKRGLFEFKRAEYLHSGDLIRAVGKIWEVVCRETCFDDSEEYTFIRKACDLYEVVGGKVESVYRRSQIESNTATETD